MLMNAFKECLQIKLRSVSFHHTYFLYCINAVDIFLDFFLQLYFTVETDQG